jgi:hypothetical protein
VSGEWGARAIDGDDLMTSAFFGAVIQTLFSWPSQRCTETRRTVTTLLYIIPYACSIATGSLSTEAPAG